MTAEWDITRVGDLADSISVTHKFDKDQLIFLNTSDVLLGRILHQSYSPVKKWPGQAKKSILKNDILFSEIRPANGRWAFVDREADNYVVSTKLMVIRARKDRIEPRFLYHYLTSRKVTRWLQHLAESRSGTFPQITFDQVAELKLPLPSKAYQGSIVAFLDMIEHKIDLNHEMNETLENIAKTIFKSWFIDFDPVRAKTEGRQPVGMSSELANLFPNCFADDDNSILPNGWTHKTVGDLCHLNPHILTKMDIFPEIRYVEISAVDRGTINEITILKRGLEPSRARRKLRHGDTVLSTVRPERMAYFLALEPENNLIASTGFAVVSPVLVPWSFIHAALTQPEVFAKLGSLADGGAYPAINPDVIAGLKLVIPDRSEIIGDFDKSATPLFSLANRNRQQSRTLAKLRDLLLPKLMSGELRIRDAEKQLEKVL